MRKAGGVKVFSRSNRGVRAPKQPKCPSKCTIGEANSHAN